MPKATATAKHPHTYMAVLPAKNNRPLRRDGQIVTGTFTWVAMELKRLVSDANRPAWDIVPVPNHTKPHRR